MDHPETETLARYARGALGRDESRALERHLAACLVCQEQVDGLPSRAGTIRWGAHRFGARKRDEEPAPETSERRERLLGVVRALGDVLAATSESAAARLLAQPEHRRRALIREDERLHTLDLCELLEARCRAAWTDDPGEAVETAKLAVLIAQRLSPELYGSRRVEDMRAGAWVHLGVSFRLASEGARVAEDAAGGEADGGYPSGALGALELRDGRLGEVEAGLRETREAFLDRGMAWDAAFVTLDLVSAFLQDGRDVAPLAREAVALFEAREADPYVIDAMRFLRDAAEGGEGVTPELVGRMARLLQRRRGGAGERFEGER